MKKALFFALSLLFSLCGCSAGRLHHPVASTQDSDSATQKFRDVYCALAYRQSIQQSFASDCRFYLRCDESTAMQSSAQHPLPYPHINAEVHFPPLRANCEYLLYCPLTGCPQNPEILLEMKTDSEGHPLPLGIVDECKEHNIRCLPSWIVTLYANPGYCSDWYLISSSPFSVLHTSFTYKPITTSLTDGRTLTVDKKEPGGNLLEICLTNFPPKERLRLISCSAGEEIIKEIETGKDGSYFLIMAPQVIGKRKAVDHITISWKDGSIDASCEWDMSTMDIKRVQAPSELWLKILSLKTRFSRSQI